MLKKSGFFAGFLRLHARECGYNLTDMVRLLLLGLTLLTASGASAARSSSASVRTAVADSLRDMGLPPDIDLPPEIPVPTVSTAPGGPGDDARIVTKCETLQSPITWSFCISRTKDSDNEDVLYYMHGLAHSEKSWAFGDGHPSAIRAYWEAKDKKMPIAVAISFGPFWLLSEKNASPKSGLLTFMTDYAIPFIERERLGGVARRRLLIGESMGGFNATQLVLKAPELFERAAIVCPAIVNASPYASAEEIAAYVRRTGADPEYVRSALQLSQSVFPDEASWETAAPLEIGRTRLGEDTPPLHLSCGDKDQYGFFEGAKAFADLARSNGVDAVWEPLTGGHCAADPAALADFLLP
jgi:pimeloyl-ACP methyl ester carboxylesterase